MAWVTLRRTLSQEGDLCFEITDWLLMPGDPSWVFGSAKEKRAMRIRMKDLSLSKTINSHQSDNCPPIVSQSGSQDGGMGLKDKPLEVKSTLTSALENNDTAVTTRRSGKLKRLRERYVHSTTPERVACPICLGGVYG